MKNFQKQAQRKENQNYEVLKSPLWGDLGGLKIFTNASLVDLNTFGIEAKAKLLIHYQTENELVELIQSGLLQNEKVLHIGGGSNLLFLNDFDGIILHSELNFILVKGETDEHVLIEVGAGVIWDDLVAYAVENGWGGIENLSLIPGEVGASAIQNIGAYGVEVCDTITEVHAINLLSGEKRIFSTSECEYDYRESIFKKSLKGQFAITSVLFKLTKTPNYKLDYQHLEEQVLKNGVLSLQNIRQTIIAIRESKLPDPKVAGNAGSFFMNPVISCTQFEKLQGDYPDMPHYFINPESEKIPAAWLIDQCGWKGKTVGRAGVHDKQALVLVNRGGATGAEIAHLASLIQQSVKEKFGIELTAEVNFI
jgi:UDP-N-acetylmuramate dehydrogenase